MTEFSNFSFSTSWNWRCGSGERIVEEILELGFREVELNYRITDRMLEAITPYVDRGTIAVSSRRTESFHHARCAENNSARQRMVGGRTVNEINVIDRLAP